MVQPVRSRSSSEAARAEGRTTPFADSMRGMVARKLARQRLEVKP